MQLFMFPHVCVRLWVGVCVRVLQTVLFTPDVFSSKNTAEEDATVSINYLSILATSSAEGTSLRTRRVGQHGPQ